MKKYVLVVGVLFLFSRFSSLSHALLSQSINPDESWLTIYQDIDRAWVAEKVTLSLHQGENRFFLTGDNLLQERFYFHPYDSSNITQSNKSTPTTDIRLKFKLNRMDLTLFFFPFL
jgi:hypothetical protein